MGLSSYFVIHRPTDHHFGDPVEWLALNGKAEVDFYGRMGGGIPEEDAIVKRAKALIKK